MELSCIKGQGNLKYSDRTHSKPGFINTTNNKHNVICSSGSNIRLRLKRDFL